MLGDVRPRLSATDVTDVCCCDSVSFCYFSITANCRANRYHLLTGQLGVSRFLANGRRIHPPTLRIHVRHVGGRRAKKQVLWVDASWIVAAVADKHPCWDCPAMEKPRNAVRAFRLAVETKSAVALGRHAIDPLPAVAVLPVL